MLRNVSTLLRKTLAEDAVLSLDNGVYKIWFARQLQNVNFPTPCCWIMQWLRWGAGLSSAMMAKIAVTQYFKSWLFVVDGGFMMNSQGAGNRCSPEA